MLCKVPCKVIQISGTVSNTIWVVYVVCDGYNDGGIGSNETMSGENKFWEEVGI